MPSTTTLFHKGVCHRKVGCDKCLAFADTAEVTIITRDSAPARVNDMLLRISGTILPLAW